MRSWRTGFDVPGEVAAGAPVAALAAFALGVAPGGIGDIRAGVSPWAMGSAALCLAVCCLGVLRTHGHRGSGWVLIGGGWAAASMSAIAAFFFIVGAGALLGLDERSVGLLAVVPVAVMAFGLVSMVPALLVLAVGITRARLLAWWGAAAVWAAAPVLPAIMLLGGFAEGTAERVGRALLASLFGLAWVVVGASLARCGHRCL